MSPPNQPKSNKKTSGSDRRFVLGGMLGVVAAPAIVKAATFRPNIVLIISDDQSKDTLALGMRKTRARTDLTWYENACATALVCAAARASIYTGQYDFRHGITNNHLASQFDYSNWLLSWAKSAGYATGFYGKMINGYPNGELPTDCVPACADWWQVFFKSDYPIFNYTLVEKRGPAAIPGVWDYAGGLPINLSTDLFKTRATNFINRYAGQTAFFLIVAPAVPHHGAEMPWRYHNAFYDLDMVALRPPSLNLVGPRQPPWLKAQPMVDPWEMDEKRRKALRATLPLDDMVVGLLDALGAVGQLDNTLFIFTTDQSVASGERRLTGKHHAYGSTTDIPLAIRWPGGAGGTSIQLVTHVDLTTTICAVAGLTPGRPLDGVDIRADARSDALLHWGGGNANGNPNKADSNPGFWGMRTGSFKYLRMKQSGIEELYALPGLEVDNLASDPAYGAVKSALDARLTELIS